MNDLLRAHRWAKGAGSGFNVTCAGRHEFQAKFTESRTAWHRLASWCSRLKDWTQPRTIVRSGLRQGISRKEDYRVDSAGSKRRQAE